jgi:hypothetical protein
MAPMSFKSWGQFISFIDDPENDDWEPLMTLNTVTAKYNVHDGSIEICSGFAAFSMAIPSEHYAEIKKSLNDRVARNKANSGSCELF